MKKRRIGPVRMAIRVVLTVVSLYVALQVFRAYNNVYSTEVVSPEGSAASRTVPRSAQIVGIAMLPSASTP